MQLHCYSATLSSIRDFGAPLVCAACGDRLIAPMASAFVEGGEIRHYWECDSCGVTSTSSIAVQDRDPDGHSHD
jgi:hypothetical protein